MANHRMISNRVLNSAKFLQMPAESQLLFIHLLLRADDDGVVELYPIMKLMGFAPDSYRVLLTRGFVRELNEDQVLVIPEWKEHNKIRPDRKTDSIYKHLIEAKYPEIVLVIPAPRKDVIDNSRRVDRPRSAQVKLSKDKISIPAEAGMLEIKEEKLDKNGELQTSVSKSPPKVPPEVKSVFDLFSDNPARRMWGKNSPQFKASLLLLESYSLSILKARLAAARKDEKELERHVEIHSPSQFLEKMKQLEKQQKRI